MYDKCLISNQIFNYEGGFHFIQGVNKYDYLDSNLYMIHLHRFDYSLHMERKLNFIKNNKYIDDPSWGYQNKLKTEEEIDSFYRSVENKVEEIPNNIKELNII